MKWLVNNWFVVFGILAVIDVIIIYSIEFVKKPKSTQISNIKEWLKYAVIQAEKELGSGTGQLKLRMVYNMAVEKFPVLIGIVTFDIFTVWVDDALSWMNKQLESNENIKLLVNGGDVIE